jgi:hypothetical protein
MYSLDLSMGTISGMAYIKMLFIISPGIGKHFIGNGLYSSDYSVMYLIHILHFFTVNSVLYKHLEEKSEERRKFFLQGYDIARKVSPVAVGSSKKKGLITLFFIRTHHTFTASETHSCSVMSYGFSLLHT